MEEKATTLESLAESAELYTKSSIDLFKLVAIDKSANMLSSLGSTLIISMGVFCITMMVNIGAALWIGKLIGSSIGGFFIVAAFYTIVVIVLVVFKKQLLKNPLGNCIVALIRQEKIFSS